MLLKGGGLIDGWMDEVDAVSCLNDTSTFVLVIRELQIRLG